MAKFRIRLKVQALELEIDGEREDIPLITRTVGRQFSGLIEPAEVAADTQKQLAPLSVPTDGDGTKGKPPRRSRANKSPADTAEPIQFRHDSGKYGNPLQTWGVAEKCLWLLHVLKHSTDTNEATAPQLVATFKHHFKAAGKLHPPHVTRELTKAKGDNPAPIGEDSGQWFLTDEGERQAKQLIKTVIGQ